MALFLKSVVDQINSGIRTHHNNKEIAFDDTTGLIYFKNEYIVKFKGFNSWVAGQEIKKESNTIKVLSKCSCHEGELYLISAVSESELLAILTGTYTISKHHLLYSPGDDDPPLPRQPQNANEIERKVTNDKGPVVKFIEEVYKKFEDDSLRRQYDNQRVNSEYPIVAILDTGIDLYYWGEDACPLYFVNTNSCDPNIPTNYGWNYVEHSFGFTEKRPFDDDELNKHGTRIAKIIANQCKNEKGYNVRLLPIKVFDFAGNASFFDIFCAFEFCMQHKVNIINASWGYYGVSFSLFEEYINELADKNIWLVNAAGNTSDFEKNVPLNIDQITEGLTRQDKSFQRFPACYGAVSDNNVITVTTVKSIQVRIMEEPSFFQRAMSILTGKKPKATFRTEIHYSPAENYSQKSVNVGVAGSSTGEFGDPISEPINFIKGSSYATAYFVGMLAFNKRLLSAPKLIVVKEICDRERAYSVSEFSPNLLGVIENQVALTQNVTI